MDLVTSRDGTPIAVWRSGSGAPLLLVHGATADHSTTWRLVQPHFEQRFTVQGDDAYPPAIIDRLEDLVAAGDAAAALVAMYREIVRMPPAEIDVMKSNIDAWAVRLRNVRTMPREARVEQNYRFESQRFMGMKVPTLLLVGGDSPPSEMRNARAVAAGLHDATIAVLPHQQHVAMHTAPDMFVREVEQFL